MGTKQPMTASLPPTPCSPEMREAVVKLAQKEGKSIADIQRSAVSLFLLQNDKAIIASENSIISTLPEVQP